MVFSVIIFIINLIFIHINIILENQKFLFIQILNNQSDLYRFKVFGLWIIYVTCSIRFENSLHYIYISILYKFIYANEFSQLIIIA